MKRKEFFKIISGASLAAVTGGMVTACGDNFLSVTPPNKLSNKTFWKTKEDAKMALVGCYHGWEGAINILFGDAMTDNLYEHSSYGYRLIGNGSINAVNYNQGTWASEYAANWFEYERVRKYNTFFANIDDVKMDPETKKVWKAEVRFLRAYDYFNKVMYFGPVPLVTELTPPTANPDRTSADKVRTFILSELENAGKILPVENCLQSNGHVTAGAALGLKARLELYMGRYEDAMEDAKAVIDMGVYELYPDYRELFLPASDSNNKEAILEINYIKNDYSNNLPQYSNPGITGWTAIQSSKSLLETYHMQNGLSITDPNSGYDPNYPFKNRDPRLRMTHVVPGGTWNGRVFVPLNEFFEDGSKNPNYRTIGNGCRTGYGVRKYLKPMSSTAMNNYAKDFMVMRLAEMYLIYAEGAAMTNMHEGLGLDYLNRVRARGGMPSVQDLTMDAVKYERRVELALEGLRYHDIARWDLGPEVMDGTLKGSRHGQYNYETGGMEWGQGDIKVEDRDFHPERNYRLPIPQSELDTNPNMTQNPGY